MRDTLDSVSASDIRLSVISKYRFKRRLSNLKMANVEDYIDDIPEVKEDKTPDEDDDIEKERESLAILASLGTTEEYLGKAMSLGDIKRLTPKQVEKYFNRYKTVMGKKVSTGLVESAISAASVLISYVIPVDDVEALNEDLKNDDLVKRELSNFAGLLVLKGGRLVALASGLFKVAKHVKLRSNEENSKKNEENEEDS